MNHRGAAEITLRCELNISPTSPNTSDKMGESHPSPKRWELRKIQEKDKRCDRLKYRAGRREDSAADDESPEMCSEFSKPVTLTRSQTSVSTWDLCCIKVSRPALISWQVKCLVCPVRITILKILLPKINMHQWSIWHHWCSQLKMRIKSRM